MAAVLPEQHHQCRGASTGKKVRKRFLTTLSAVRERNLLYIHPSSQKLLFFSSP